MSSIVNPQAPDRGASPCVDWVGLWTDVYICLRFPTFLYLQLINILQAYAWSNSFVPVAYSYGVLGTLSFLRFAIIGIACVQFRVKENLR